MLVGELTKKLQRYSSYEQFLVIYQVAIENRAGKSILLWLGRIPKKEGVRRAWTH